MNARALCTFLDKLQDPSWRQPLFIKTLRCSRLLLEQKDHPGALAPLLPLLML